MTEATVSCYARREERETVFVLEGCLDVETSPRAVDRLQQFAEEHGPNVTVDASRLDFIDSKGVGALIAAAKQVRDLGGMLYLRSPAVPVQKILETCGLMSLFPPPPPPGQGEPPAAPPADEVSRTPSRAATRTSAPRAARPARTAA